MENNLKMGWLSPYGDFYPTGCEEHISEARNIVKTLNININGKQCDDILIDNGWVHITILSFMEHGWDIFWKNHLTEYQKEFLKPYFEEVYFPVTESTKIRWEYENRI